MGQLGHVTHQVGVYPQCGTPQATWTDDYSTLIEGRGRGSYRCVGVPHVLHMPAPPPAGGSTGGVRKSRLYRSLYSDGVVDVHSGAVSEPAASNARFQLT